MDSERESPDKFRELPPLRVPHRAGSYSPMSGSERDGEDSGYGALNANTSPMLRSPLESPLMRLLSSPHVGQKLQESGLLDDVESVVSELAEELAVAQNEISQLKEENAELQDSLEIGQMERSAKIVEVVQLQGGLRTAQQEANSLKKENARLQKVLMTEVSEIEGEMQAKQQQYLLMKEKHEGMVAALEQTKKEKEEVMVEMGKLQTRMIEVLERSSQQLVELQKVHQDRASLKGEVAELRGTLKVAFKEKAILQEENSRLRANMEATCHERDDLENLVRDIMTRRVAQQSALKTLQMRNELGKVENALQGVLISADIRNHVDDEDKMQIMAG